MKKNEIQQDNENALEKSFTKEFEQKEISDDERNFKNYSKIKDL